MKKRILFLFTVILAVSMHIHAQQGVTGNIKAENVETKRENGMVTMSMLLNLEGLDLKSQEMVYLLPVLVSSDSLYTQEFDPIVFTGAKRNIALERQIDFEGFQFEDEPQDIVRYKKRSKQLYPLTLTTNYQEWLHNASLVFYEDVTGCGCRNEYSNRYTAMNPVLPMPYNPTYTSAYIITSDRGKNPVNENYTAYLNFKLAKYDVLPTYKGNAEALEEVSKIVQTIRNNPDLIVTGFQITGYASPEGNYDYNMHLSENRAKEFASYLAKEYNIPSDQMKVDWKGEDWDGLQVLISQSNIQDKDSILSILRNESDLNTCEAKLKKLSGGRTYQTMLQDYYPKLRRNDYDISYVSRAFTAEEAKNIYQTRPELLDLQEMYRMAAEHPQGSDGYKDVIYTAAKYYPDDHTLLVNVAACQLDEGEYAQVIETLEKVETPEAWNNLAIAYYYQDDHEKAKHYFQKASISGLECATTNSRELEKCLAEKF